MVSVKGESYSSPQRWSPPPVVIFSAVCILTASTLLATTVSLALYSIPSVTASVRTCQALILVSSSVTFVFIGIYVVAARRNEPVGDLRPPIRPWHGTCFIVMRIMLVLWLITAIVTMAATTRIQACQGTGNLCVLQGIIAAASALTAIISSIVLSTIERCDMAFETPSTLKIRPKIACCISSFDDILERNVSRVDTIDCDKRHQDSFSDTSIVLGRTTASENRPESRPLPPSPEPPAESIFSASPNWPFPRNNWSAAWENLVEETGRKGVPSSASNSSSSSFSSSLASKPNSFSLTQTHSSSPRDSPASSGRSHKSCHLKGGTVSSSSSISSIEKRSPLSTMRTVENPEVVVRSELRFISLLNNPPSPPRQQRYYSRSRSGGQPLYHSYTLRQKAVPGLPYSKGNLLPRSSASDISSRRSRPNTPNGSRPPGLRAANIASTGPSKRYRPVMNHDSSIDAHTRQIESAIRKSMEERQFKALTEAKSRNMDHQGRNRSLTHQVRSNPHGREGETSVPVVF